MGQKVHPTGIRLGVVKDHTSVWYASRAASSVLHRMPVSPFTLPVQAS
jgi:small subunit ribosomal protein S3